jgi:hypothetical protein
VRYFPPNRGFAGAPKETVIEVNSILDRNGSSLGEYLFAKKPLFLFRSLPPESEALPLKSYLVKKEFSALLGRAGSWYGKAGGSLQIHLGVGMTVQELINQGFLEEVTVT